MPKSVAPNLEMLDGFNSGWIDFEESDAEHKADIVAPETILARALFD